MKNTSMYLSYFIYPIFCDFLNINFRPFLLAQLIKKIYLDILDSCPLQ